MARSSNEALEALITAANEYAAAKTACGYAAKTACDAAAIEAYPHAVARKAAMTTLDAAIIHVKATADYVLLAAAMYEAAAKGKGK